MPELIPDLPTVTDKAGMFEAIAEELDKVYLNIAKQTEAYHDSVVNAYSFQLPDLLTDWLGVKRIGGKTVIWNQLANFGTITFDGTYRFAFTSGVSIVVGHKYYMCADITSVNNSTVNVYTRESGSNRVIGFVSRDDNAKIFVASYGGTSDGTDTSVDGNIWLYLASFTNDDTVTNIMLIDLTLMFGAGNEPSTVEDVQKVFPSIYEFDPGTLLSVGVNKIISADSANNVIDSYTIPEDATTMEGYGWSCPGAYNYIDFEAKKFVQAVGIRAYEAGDESDATVITDGTNTYYEMDEPLVFDVDLPDETITDVEAGGSLTFPNQHGDDYKIPVPAKMEYIGVA